MGSFSEQVGVVLRCVSDAVCGLEDEILSLITRVVVEGLRALKKNAARQIAQHRNQRLSQMQRQAIRTCSIRCSQPGVGPKKLPFRQDR